MEAVTYDKKTITIQTPGGPYYIPLAEARTPAEVQDWIRHVGKKTWGACILPELRAMFEKLAG
jgi:hypothetical protein